MKNQSIKTNFELTMPGILRKIEDLSLNPTNMTSFSICHWNLNSIAAHNFSKIQSLIVYDCMHHFDFICFSETYLNSNILSDNENLNIPGYRLVRS